MTNDQRPPSAAPEGPKQFESRDHYLALLDRVGARLDDALVKVGIDKPVAAAGGEMLDPTTFYAFVDAVDELNDDPELAIRVGKEAARLAFEPRYMSFEPPLFAAFMSPTWALMIERISRYSAPRSPIQTRVQATELDVTIEYGWPVDDRPPPLLALAEFVYWISIGRLRTQSRFEPLKVVTVVPPADLAPFEAFFGVPVEIGDRHRMVVDARTANLPFVDVTQEIWEHFEPELERQLAQSQPATPLVEAIRESLATLMPAGEATIERVAYKLDMSPRTLQRRLREDGTNFREVLNQTRETMAIHYLTNSKRSVAEIASQLGYDNASSFTRALSTWTGQTPRQIRHPQPKASSTRR